MKVIIPAAGLGRRFVAQGIITPKELLPLGGKPLIWYALREAALAGFESAIVVISPSKQALRECLSDRQAPIGVEIVVQPQPLGIGDAVLRAWPGTTTGILLPDDVVTSAHHWDSLIRKHAASGAAALCVRSVSPGSTERFGIAECAGDRVLRLIEKPPTGTTTSNLAIFGRYIANEAVVEALRIRPLNGELELTYGFAGAIASQAGVRAVPFSGRVFDCGTPDEYAASSARFGD